MTNLPVTALSRPPEVRKTNNDSAPSHPTSPKDGDGRGTDWMGELVRRGVVQANAQRLVDSYGDTQVSGAVAYFDEQRPGSVGAGILVRAVREGRQPARQAAQTVADAAAAQGWDERLAAIAAWCHEHLPDVCGPQLHVGAFQFVWRHGLQPNDLSVVEHGDVIRGAVRAWEDKWGCEGSPVTKGSA